MTRPHANSGNHFEALGCILQSQHTPTERIVAVYLWWRSNKGGLAWPSVAKMCGDLRISRRTAQIALRELERGGIIRIEALTGQPLDEIVSRFGAGHVPAAYRISQSPFNGRGAQPSAPRPAQPSAPLKTGVGRNTVPGGAQSSVDVGRSQLRPNPKGTPKEPTTCARTRKTSRKTRTKTAPREHAPSPVKNPRALSVAAAAQVDSVWAAFPRKVAKKKALPAIRTAIAKIGHPKLLAHVEAYRARMASKIGTNDERFIMHCSTYMTGERWADEPSASAPAAEVDHLPALNFPRDKQ